MKIALYLVLLVFIAAGTPGLASCGTSDPPAVTIAPTVTAPVETGAPIPVDNVEVLIENFEYLPPSIIIPPGTVITWTNKDSMAHTVTSRDDIFDSGLFGRDETFSYTFTEPGEYEYYCIPHPYMVGKVVVK